MSEVKHTPTPWEVVKNMSWEDIHGNAPTKDENNLMGFIGGDGSRICWFGDSTTYYPTEGDEPSEVNAAHIVKCVNLHDELVEALKMARSDFMAEYEMRYKDEPTDTPYCEALKKAGAL